MNEHTAARIESLIDQWDAAQQGVPDGWHCCPECNALFNYEPIQKYPHPDSPASCYNCLDDGTKAAYGRST